MSDPSVLPAIREPRKRTTFLCLAALLLCTCVIAARDIHVGGFSWSDAPLHAMDGVFLHDLVREWPSGAWKAWAEQYYLKHQCLGILVYYPPLFAAVEAVVFLLLGISVLAARLTVLLFVVGAVWLLFLLGRELFGTTAGLIGALAAIVTPASVSWSRQVMLEWPATFWIALALLAYVRCLRSPGWRWGLLTAVGCAGAYLTKQTAAFVLPVIVAHVILLRQWKLIRRVEFVVPMALAATIIFAYGRATAGLNALAPQLVAGTPPWRHLLTLEHWTWYLARTPSILGWPMLLGLAAALTGRLVAGRSASDTAPARTPGGLVLLVLWAGGWWLISTLICAKEERYLFFAAPAVALMFGADVARLIGARPRRAVSIIPAVLSILLLLAAGIGAIVAPAQRLVDMRPTVDYLAGRPDADLVLIDAVRDGQFIFDVRRLDGEPDRTARLIPMRASKLLYSRAARTRYSYAQHVESPADIVELLDRLGIRYIVLEDRLPTASRPDQPAPDEDRSWDTPPRLMLRELVADASRFERVFTQPLACEDPTWDDVSLVTYRYENAPSRTTDTVTIPVPAMGKNVELRLVEPR